MTDIKPDPNQADPIPKKVVPDFVALDRHKRSTFNALLNNGVHKTTSGKTLEDIEEGRVTPVTQMSTMEAEPVTEKLPFAHEEMVVPSVKLPLPSDIVVEASLDTEGPRFNLPKIERLRATPSPVEPWVTNDVVPFDDQRPSTSGASSSNTPHEEHVSSPEGETREPPRPMSRNAARWAPTFVTQSRSQVSLQSIDDSDEEVGKFSRADRPKSQYRVREAKPEEAQYDGPYSSYPDSHTPML